MRCKKSCWFFTGIPLSLLSFFLHPSCSLLLSPSSPHLLSLPMQSKPKATIVELKSCQLKHRDPSEKLTDEQFIINDDNGSLIARLVTNL